MMKNNAEKKTALWSVKCQPGFRDWASREITELKLDKAGVTLVALYHYLTCDEDVRREINKQYDEFVAGGVGARDEKTATPDQLRQAQELADQSETVEPVGNGNGSESPR